MNTHQPDIHGNTSNFDQGDPYENVETRPGTTEKQKETGRCAYTDLLEAHARWAGGTLLGSRFPKNFHEQGGTHAAESADQVGARSRTASMPATTVQLNTATVALTWWAKPAPMSVLPVISIAQQFVG